MKIRAISKLRYGLQQAVNAGIFTRDEADLIIALVEFHEGRDIPQLHFPSEADAAFAFDLLTSFGLLTTGDHR